MRAVLSSLVLLLGSAIALPSLLRTGDHPDEDENIAKNIENIEKIENIAKMRILLMMIQLSGIPVEERFSNHPKSKLSLMPR